MAKKSSNQPNAPEYQQVLLDSLMTQQLPHNPYYPDLGPAQPPPYADNPRNIDHSLGSASDNRHIDFNQRYNPRGSSSARMDVRGGATVIIPQQTTTFDRSYERYHKKVSSFNSQTCLIAIIAIGLSMYAAALYQERPCYDYLVHQPTKDVDIYLNDVKNMHLNVAAGSVFIVILSMLKCCVGRSKSYGCYLTIMGFCLFIGTLLTGYLTYLTFYSPCTAKIGEVFSKSLKTIFGQIAKLPAPDKRAFGEENVIQTAKDDPYGLYIFVLDFVNFIMYVSAFIGTLSLC